MILSQIDLKNVRIHKKLQLTFSGGINYIIGGNGLGKTTILESVYYLCTTKSQSTTADIEVLSFNEGEFAIEGKFSDRTDNVVRLYYSSNDNKKHYVLDGKQVHRYADVIGKFPVVFLTPSDHSITQGSPAGRRKFVDSVLSQASSTYLKSLLDMNRILRNRSVLLSRMKENRKYNLPELDAWTTRLIQTGSEIIRYRKKFCYEFSVHISKAYEVIMDENEIPIMKYDHLSGNKEEDIEEVFSRLLFDRKDEELRRSVNLVGPHRDDFVFEINGVNLRVYGSQGQHKTFQVALRFAEFFYLKELTGKTPIFLLDDVFGELDTKRASRISGYLRNIGQAIITLTDLTNISFLNKNEDDKIIQLKEGEVQYA